MSVKPFNLHSKTYHSKQMSAPLSSPLRVAVVGTGYFSRFHYAAWQRMPDVELVALHALDEEQGKALQNEFDIQHRFSELHLLLEQSGADVIDVITPPNSHAMIIEQCIEHGKAVICQKPFCNSVIEAEHIASRVATLNAFVAVHENFRFQPWYQEIKQIIDSERLGNIYEINFDFRPGDGQGNNAYLQRQPYFQKQKKFLIQETGVHFIDVFRYLMGDITGLFARLTKLNPVIAGEDAGVIVMEFQNGARGILNANRLADHCAQDTRLTMGEMRIEGSAGSLYLNGMGRIHIRAHGSTALQEHNYEWHDMHFGGDCVYTTNRHIADHLLYQKPVYNLAAEYVTNRQIEEHIYASDESEAWIKL